MQFDVLVEDLDRILDRDDVLLARAVDVVDDRGESRRLAGAGPAGDEHEAAMLLRELPHTRREPERVEGRDLSCGSSRNANEIGAALPEAVDAEARQALRLVRDVELAVRMERVVPAGRGSVTGARLRQVGVGQLGGTLDERDEVAVAAKDRRPAALEMDVARADFDRVRKDGVEIHDIHCVGSEPRSL